MTVAANTSSLAGFPPAGNANAFVEVATATSGYVPLAKPGTRINVIDPYWGGMNLIRLSIPTSTAVKVGALATWDNNFSYVACPVPVQNTSTMGMPVAIALNDVPSNATYVQYAWFVTNGVCPVYSNASVAANVEIGIAATGQAGANGTGVQLIGARSRVAATTTVAKVAAMTPASTIIKVPNTNGWFVGGYLSGTGITGGTTITAIDPDDRSVTMSAIATAAGVGNQTITMTYNNSTIFWNVCTVESPNTLGKLN